MKEVDHLGGKKSGLGHYFDISKFNNQMHLNHSSYIAGNQISMMSLQEVLNTVQGRLFCPKLSVIKWNRMKLK